MVIRCKARPILPISVRAPVATTSATPWHQHRAGEYERQVVASRTADLRFAVPGLLAHRDGFPGQQRFIRLEIVTIEKHRVRGGQLVIALGSETRRDLGLREAGDPVQLGFSHRHFFASGGKPRR